MDITYPFVSPHVQQSQNGCELFSFFLRFCFFSFRTWRERKQKLTHFNHQVSYYPQNGRKEAKEKRREEEIENVREEKVYFGVEEVGSREKGFLVNFSKNRV